MWKEQRKFTHRVLRDFGMGKSITEEKIVEELSYFLPKLKEMASSGAFDPHQILQISVSNIICSIVFGKRFDYDDSEYINLMHMMNQNFKVHI